MEGTSVLNVRIEDMGKLAHPLERSTKALAMDTAPESCRNTERILLAAQLQQLRQLRRLQQMKKHSEMTAAQQAAWEAKEREEQMRSKMRHAEAAVETACRVAKAAEAEARRKAARQAATVQEEDYRQRLSEKLERSRPRLDATVIEYERRVSAARSAARMQRTLARKEQVLEEKRAAVLAAEDAAERRLQQKLELRLLQEAIKREEESRAEERRRAIQDRAEADEAAKVAYYEAKNKAREQRLKERREEDVLMRSLHAEESRARFDSIRSRADTVNEQQEARRHALLKKLEGKFGRVEALAAERQALQKQVKKTLEAQEMQIKQVFGKMAMTGKLELPPELLTTLTALESAVTSPYSPRSGACSPHQSRSRACSPDLTGIGGNVSLNSPRSLVTSCKINPPPGVLPAAAIQLQRHQEAALQRVLEEEILQEMARENRIQQISAPEERRKVMKQVAAERESAKARILGVGNQLLTLSKPGTLTSRMGRLDHPIETQSTASR